VEGNPRERLEGDREPEKGLKKTENQRKDERR